MNRNFLRAGLQTRNVTARADAHRARPGSQVSQKSGGLKGRHRTSTMSPLQGSKELPVKPGPPSLWLSSPGFHIAGFQPLAPTAICKRFTHPSLFGHIL